MTVLSVYNTDVMNSLLHHLEPERKKDYKFKTIKVFNLIIFVRVHLFVFWRWKIFILSFLSPRSQLVSFVYAHYSSIRLSANSRL